jgi:hypothetical protein
MKYLLTLFIISLLIISGCSSKETLNELKQENKQLKQENTKLLESYKKLKQENTKLLEVDEVLNDQSANVDNLPYPISTTINHISTPDLNNIAKELFTDYLNFYTKNNVNSQQLKNYTIDKLNIEKSDKSSFVFYVEFSLQPYDVQTWIAGNGIDSKDGWIHQKSYYVKIGIKDRTYTMESHGTSP